MALPPIQFLSNTPPPIDFEDDKDEIINDDVNFSNFEDHLEISKNCDLELPNATFSENEDNGIIKEFNQSPFRNESPPSLVFSEKLDIEDVAIDKQNSSEEMKTDNEIPIKVLDESESSQEEFQLPADIPDIPIDTTSNFNDWNDFVTESDDGNKVCEPDELPEEVLDVPKDNINVIDDEDDFCDFVNHNTNEIITHSEPIVVENPIENGPTVITNEDADDDFADFEAVIPSDRKLDNQFVEKASVEIEPENNEFAVDFDTFSTTEFKFDAFEDNEVVEPSKDKEIEEIDDDFDDFNDFESAEIVQPSHSENIVPIPLNITPVNCNATLQDMFPSVEDQESAEEILENLTQYILANFNDTDSMNALNYQYNSSKTNLTLIKSLGIDNRNVLFGAQWCSKMPLFAANLSTVPLEPIKSTSKVSPKPTRHEILKPEPINSQSETNKSSPSLSSSSSANVLQDSGILEIVQPDNSNLFDEQRTNRMDDQDGIVAATKKYSNVDDRTQSIINRMYNLDLIAQSPQQSVKTDLENCEIRPSSIIPIDSGKLLNCDKRSLPNLTGTTVRTIKLPETHIFTPVKGTNTISQEVTSHDDHILSMDGAFNEIAFKEYHDVEYKLEKPKTDDILSNNFESIADDFYFKVLEPQKLSSEQHFVTNQSMEINNTTIDAKPLSPILKMKQPKETSFAKPVIGTSPTEESANNATSFDEDFSDFQAAPLPIQPQVNGIVKKTGSAWNDSLIDANEVARIEAAFPKCKTETVIEKEKEKNEEKHVDDEEWSEFVSPPKIENATNVNSSNNNNINNNNNIDDDWSDFVAVPPKISSTRDFSLSSQMSIGPSFSPWHQPSLPPQQFTNPYSNFEFGGFSSAAASATNNNSKENHQHYLQSRNPNIAIIPELNFSMPKSIVNLPYNNLGNLTKK